MTKSGLADAWEWWILVADGAEFAIFADNGDDIDENRLGRCVV